MILLGGGLIAYQVRDWFPTRPQMAYVDPMVAMVEGLTKVHQHPLDPTRITSDLHDFQQRLPTSMPVAALAEAGATLVGASVEELNGRLCYAVRYQIQGKTFTLVTANTGMYYEIPKYNEVQGALRLVGFEREGYLVCLIGDAGVPETTYQALLHGAKMLPSPSTQPVSSVSLGGHCTVAQ
jgi:hypothetical protein